jgi:hypothetical protein
VSHYSIDDIGSVCVMLRDWSNGPLASRTYGSGHGGGVAAMEAAADFLARTAKGENVPHFQAESHQESMTGKVPSEETASLSPVEESLAMIRGLRKFAGRGSAVEDKRLYLECLKAEADLVLSEQKQGLLYSLVTDLCDKLDSFVGDRASVSPPDPLFRARALPPDLGSVTLTFGDGTERQYESEHLDDVLAILSDRWGA